MPKARRSKTDQEADHDWSSHAADGFGLMAISYEDPQRVANFRKPIVFPKVGVA
jgi:phage terminase large subunit